jgi:lipoprotein-anchoring transpeptidase ErfK/SrfK
VSRDGFKEKAARIEVDKTKQVLKVFGKSDTLLAVYPVTAGSTEKPAPDGALKVVSVSKNPTYRYNPDYAFKGVKSREPFTIKPGPNNPVGLVWIGLNKEGYGIHGTPEPSKISKSESHGCIRLTNWDALQLASAVRKGISVEFTGDERERASRAQTPRKAHRKRR